MTPALLRIIFVASLDVKGILEAGSHEAVFGSTIDLGTTAVLDGVKCVDALREASTRLAEEHIRNGNVVIEEVLWREIERPAACRELLEGACFTGRLLAVVWQEGEDPVLIVAGKDLPSMGFAGACSFDRFEGTVRFLIGDAAAAVNSVFAEPPLEASANEHLLMLRLRHLYGD